MSGAVSRLDVAFMQSPKLCPGCAPRSGLVNIMSVFVRSHSSFCGEAKAEICPGSDFSLEKKV